MACVASRVEICKEIKPMPPITRAELIAHIRATAERMAQTAQLMQQYDGPQHIAERGREMESAARMAHGWADGIAADGPPDVHEA